MTTALTHIDDPTFRERLVHLLAPIDAIAPGLFGPDLNDWARGLAKIRNNEAHQLGTADTFGPTEATLYLGYATSARWALRLTLLHRTMDPADLHTHINRRAFHRDLEDLDQHGFYPLTAGNPTSYSAADTSTASFPTP